MEPPGRIQRSCRQVAFTPNAQPHRDLAGDDVGEILSDWSDEPDVAPTAGRIPLDPIWEEADGTLPDLIEAVYAGGRRGWDEGDLVGIVGEAFGDAVDPWIMLRLLRDATLIQPRLRHRWRGRIWTLRAPALAPFQGGAIVQGAVCEAEAELFRKAASTLGGRPFRNHGTLGLSPPIIGCVGGDLPALAGRLGWRLEEAGTSAGPAPMAFRETSHALLGKEAASRWDWDLAKFVADGRRGDGAVSLTRFVQAACRDHDVYQICAAGREHRLMSRDAAVVLAHCLARRPLFTVSDGILEARVRGAFLPDGIAAALRLSSLANPGWADGVYRYRLSPEQAAQLAILLPGAVPGIAHAAVMSVADELAFARHSSGRIRAVWTNGTMTTTAASESEFRKGLR
ncbi:hypothetical protein MKK70_08405 [Methylobacterium sp. E-041]|uniref:hypothetical protein n=1 Tax=Methylobacterium sp. E-041 TaxID=2836573 RepID=UPI001FBA6966|nr:hypothetical protein [Methylobacterium sp. E-041]MCJ2105399.1 hypothetical protein [Methylobacterium sp. E-041]